MPQAVPKQSGHAVAAEKRLPQSTKYEGIQSTLDTGASASKRPPPMPPGMVAQRRAEEFKRIRPATLSAMLEQYQEDGLESVFNHGADDRNDRASLCSVRSAAGPAPAKSRAAASMVSCAGSVLSIIESDTNLADSRKLVLLDLREQDEYAKCRIPFAISYPATMINQDRFIPELNTCKRDSSKLLVVYHTNDGTTSAVATLLLRKGWDSVHCLSGGFEDMLNNYPEVLEGDIPDRKMSSRPNTGTSGSTRSSSVPRLPGEIRRGNSIPRRTTGSNRSASLRSDASSVRSSSMRSGSVR